MKQHSKNPEFYWCTTNFLQRRQSQKLAFISFGAVILLLHLFTLNTLNAEELNDHTCPQKKLSGVGAQEMMVKGVIMQSELEKVKTDTYDQYTFIHTVRADWTIWICIQSVEVKNGEPDKLTLACTACDY